MKVPLRVDLKSANNREYLTIWHNDKPKTIKSPINPYFYTKKPLTYQKSIRSETKAKALSNAQLRTFYKHKFRTRKELVMARSDDTFEDNIPFIIRNRLDNPDLFYKYPQKELRFLFFDIEQESTNDMFPTYSDRITSIAWATNDRKVKCIYLKDSISDKKLLEQFLEAYQQIDPHVLIVYNKDYDIPTLIRRLEKNKIPTTSLSKTRRKPYFGGKDDYHIDGIVIYDVAQSAFKDQSLNGEVANRGLKEVSNHFGFNEQRPPLTPKQMNQYIGTKTLAKYNMDDVYRLMLTFDVYWTNIEFNANDLGIPLNDAINMNTTNLALITLGDEYKKQNIIADGSNAQRYPEIFKRKKKSGEKNYEGALVRIDNTGTFRPIYKADYSSMYPSIMAEFNLSPDTTTLIKYEKYRPQFEMMEKEDYYMYAIPDAEINKTLIIKVLKKQGFASKLVKKMLDERSIYKSQYKKTGNLKDKALSSNRKVKANGGIYGIQGSAHHAFGFAPIAIATTAIGREVMKILLDIIKDFYGDVITDVDSVTGDTPIFIRDKKTKEIDIIPIRDLSDDSLRLKISNLDTLTKNGWKNLNYVYSHNVNKRIYTIKSHSSRIDVTEDHSIFSEGKEKTPKELKIGDNIDLYPSTDFDGKNKQINKKKAWLLGFFLSNGTICKRKANKKIFFNKDGSRRKLIKSEHYDFTIAKKDIILLNKAQEILKDEYGLVCKIYDTLKSSGCYKLEGWKKEPIKEIREMCYCKDKKTKKVPKEILNAPLDIVESFFDGLTDGDGHIRTDKKGKGVWTICSIFKPLLSGIAYLLDRRGITYIVSTRRDKPHVTTVTTHKPKENCVCKKPVLKRPRRVSKISYEKREETVYDLGTDDSTFVAGIGRVICHNTDGTYYTCKEASFNKNKIQNELSKRLKEKFNRRVNLSIDFDEYKAGYFYRAKNYVLLTKDDKLIFHGATMKSSSKNILSKQLIHQLAEAKLFNRPIQPIVEKFINLDFPLKHFAMNVRMGRPLYKYKSKRALAYRLALMAKEQLGLEPEQGNIYHYIKSKDGYKLYQTAKKEDIDRKYYRDQVETILDIFNEKPKQQSLEEWI